MNKQKIQNVRKTNVGVAVHGNPKIKSNVGVALLGDPKGITLIALVITIVVLIILAGVAINLTLNNNGIFTKAKEARENYMVAANEEQEAITNIEESIDEITGYTSYTRGQTVTIGTESFYVLHDSGASEEKVTLLAAKNIKTSTLLQADDADKIAFYTDPDSTGEGYWTSIPEITYPKDLNNVESERATVINYAKAYGEKFGVETGRLMTVGEAREITGLTTAGKITSPDWIKTTNYWLGSANSTIGVWYVFDGILTDSFFFGSFGFGVRPVIEISKSLI